MPPNKRETILICPVCKRAGFLRKKHGKFHLPQKSKITSLYTFLDYLSKLYFKRFAKSITSANHQKQMKSLNVYNSLVVCYKTRINRIKEFELKAIESIVSKYRAQNYNIIFSEELLRSNHLKELNGVNNSANDGDNTKTVYISRAKLFLLFNSIIFVSLSKYLEIHRLGIEERFEKEFVERIKNFFYFFESDLDNRSKIDILGMLDPNNHLNRPQRIKRCLNCKTEYPVSHKNKCKCGSRIYFHKIKHSKKQVRKKSLEVTTNLLNAPKGLLSYVSYMNLLQEKWFVIPKFRRDFQQQFDSHEKAILNGLNVEGNVYYSIVHYLKSKNRNVLSIMILTL